MSGQRTSCLSTTHTHTHRGELCVHACRCQTTASEIKAGVGFARPSEHVKQLSELFSQPLFSASVIIRFYKVSERALQA